MNFVPLHELRTKRLLLRKLCMDDAPCFYDRLGGNEQVARHMLWMPHRSISESEESIRKALQRYDTGRFYRWGITLRENGQLIGMIDLLGFDEALSACRFAYMLDPNYWNRGYGTEAVQAVFDFAFQELEMDIITADHFAENPASGAVMRKVNMTCTGTAFHKYQKNGILHDAVQYRITREDWVGR